MLKCLFEESYRSSVKVHFNVINIHENCNNLHTGNVSAYISNDFNVREQWIKKHYDMNQ